MQLKCTVKKWQLVCWANLQRMDGDKEVLTPGPLFTIPLGPGVNSIWESGTQQADCPSLSPTVCTPQRPATGKPLCPSAGAETALVGTALTSLDTSISIPLPGTKLLPEILTEVWAKCKGDSLMILGLSALFFIDLPQTTSTCTETPTCLKGKEDIKH